jgi:hypothetical protein
LLKTEKPLIEKTLMIAERIVDAAGGAAHFIGRIRHLPRGALNLFAS